MNRRVLAEDGCSCLQTLNYGMLRNVDLLESHSELTARLNAHLQAVVMGELDRSRQAFRSFAALLYAHSQSEDEVLIPIFARLNLESNGCSVDLLMKEHRKLRRLCADVRARVFADKVALTPAVRLTWIEQTRLLKEVLEHHDMRERAAFHPALDAALDQTEAAAYAGEARALEQQLEAQYLAAAVNP